MARLIYALRKPFNDLYHVYTDLDFWDARRILKGLAIVKRNFGKQPPGDKFPTQIVLEHPTSMAITEIEKRVKRAISSPPRHVVVSEMLDRGRFEFDPSRYYPSRWSPSQIVHFTTRRLPIHIPPLSTPYMTVRVTYEEGKVIVERIHRPFKYDPKITTKGEALRRLRVPLCF